MDFLFIVTVSDRALFVFPERLTVVGYLSNMVNAPRRDLEGSSQFCNLGRRATMPYKVQIDRTYARPPSAPPSRDPEPSSRISPPVAPGPAPPVLP